MEIVLVFMDLDLALLAEQPTFVMESSTSEQRKDYEKRDHSNRMSLMIIKCDVLVVFRGTISKDITNVKKILIEIEKRFKKRNKAKTSSLLRNLISMKFQGKGNIMEYNMEMSKIVSKLKALKLEMFEGLLIHLVLLYLPLQFS